MTLLRRLLLLGLPLMVAACGSDTPTSPTTTSSAPYSQTDLVVGTGAEAALTSRLTVSYTGWLYDTSKPDGKGTQFDTSPSATFALSRRHRRMATRRPRDEGRRTAPADYST